MSKRLSGRSMKFKVGFLKVNCDFDLTVNLNNSVAYTNGVPNGDTDGQAEGSGKITVDSRNLAIISAAAKAAGSWREIAPVDIVGAGVTTGDALYIEAFGCRLSLEDIIKSDQNSADQLKHTIGYQVTSSKFVKVNGVSILSDEETADII